MQNEVACLSKIYHQNVISLLGYCIHGDTRFLVYEMMHNGSLESQLHGKSIPCNPRTDYNKNDMSFTTLLELN